MYSVEDIEKVYFAFHAEIPVFMAFSDDERLKLFLRILQKGKEGIHVNALTSTSHLSRPAVSHHLKILKDCGLISFRKIGTKVYYFVSFEQDKFEQLKKNLTILSDGLRNADLEEIAKSSGIAEIINAPTEK